MGEQIIKRYDCDSCMTKELEPSQCYRVIVEDVLTGVVVYKKIFCVECYEKQMIKVNEISKHDEITSMLDIIQLKKEQNRGNDL